MSRVKKISEGTCIVKHTTSDFTVNLKAFERFRYEELESFGISIYRVYIGDEAYVVSGKRFRTYFRLSEVEASATLIDN